MKSCVRSAGAAVHPREERTAKFSSNLSLQADVSKNFDVGLGADEIGVFFLQKKK